MQGLTDHIYRFYSEDLSLRASVAVMTHTVRQICEMQKTDPVATIALGRVVVGATLLASGLREGQQVGVLFDGDGPLGPVFGEATKEGEVRGYCTNATFAGGTPQELEAYAQM